MPRRELANQVVRPVLLDQFVETRPRNQFQHVMEDAIDMAHGVDPFRVLMSRETLDTSRINVVRRFKKNEPDSRGSSPAMANGKTSALSRPTQPPIRIAAAATISVMPSHSRALG